MRNVRVREQSSLQQVKGREVAWINTRNRGQNSQPKPLLTWVQLKTGTKMNFKRHTFIFKTVFICVIGEDTSKS